MLATAFEPWNLKVLSSVVLTHAFFAFLERHAAWHMTRWPADPLDKAAAAAEWVSGGGGKDGSKGGKMSGGAAASAKRGGEYRHWLSPCLSRLDSSICLFVVLLQGGGWLVGACCLCAHACRPAVWSVQHALDDVVICMCFITTVV